MMSEMFIGEKTWQVESSAVIKRQAQVALLADQLQEVVLANHRNPELLGLLELASCVFAGDQVIGFLRDAAGRLAAVLLDEFGDLFAAVTAERAGDHERLPRERPRRRGSRAVDRFAEVESLLAQLFDNLLADG